VSSLYKQVKMQKANIEAYAWIPVEFARPGKIIKIKTTGEWDDGWEVIDAPGQAIDAAKLDSQFQEDKRWLDVLEGKREVGFHIPGQNLV
jgi:hypothetical protein